jgi:hypothetical protein
MPHNTFSGRLCGEIFSIVGHMIVTTAATTNAGINVVSELKQKNSTKWKCGLTFKKVDLNLSIFG